MKRLLLLISIFTSSFFTALLAQERIISYYKEDGSKVSNRESAYFYGVVTPNDQSTLFSYNEYYSKDNTPKVVATLKNSSNINTKVGLYESFYPNGKLREKKHYNNFHKLVDSAYSYYDTGILKAVLFYTKPTDGYILPEKQGGKEDNTQYILVQDSTGRKLVENGKGIFVITGSSKKNPDTEQGQLLNHKRDGLWTGNFGSFTFKETWQNGKLLQGVSTDSLGGTIDYNESTLSVEPDYPGGINALRATVGNNFHYPKEAMDVGVSGTVVVDFLVEKDGQMSSFKVKQDIGYKTGAAAIQAIKKARGTWSPGVRRGRPVRVAYSLPIVLNML